jgi:1-deoxy-D-xylulose-5-phosphate reductoisomerase
MSLMAENHPPLENSQPQRISILGATGSIGTSTLDLIAHHGTKFSVDALTANSNAQLLAHQARKFKAKFAVVADENAYSELCEALSGSGIETAAGKSGLIEAAERPVECVIAAIVGTSGLDSTLAAIKKGQRVGLANKECLVCAGDLFMHEVVKSQATLLPVDSEHSAIFQLFDFDRPERVDKIILTASGGPFLNVPLEVMENATPEMALKHPNWQMGRKISIDSATMMNKGLELIEAYHLFPVSIDQLDVLIHPNSVIHSLVQYCDGSVLAHLGTPDMCIPIAYALTWPDRIECPVKPLNLAQIGTLSFEELCNDRFPALALCRQALQTGGSGPTILNAANEIAVEKFLDHHIGFGDIARLIREVMEQADRDNMMKKASDLHEIAAVDSYARQRALAAVAKFAK